MSYLRSKSVLQRTAFRGFIEVGDDLRIGVWSFLKTMEAKFPSLSKVSVVSQQSAHPNTMGVKLERSCVGSPLVCLCTFYAFPCPSHTHTHTHAAHGTQSQN